MLLPAHLQIGLLHYIFRHLQLEINPISSKGKLQRREYDIYNKKTPL